MNSVKKQMRQTVSSGRLGQEYGKSKERLDRFSQTQKRPLSSYDNNASTRPGTAYNITASTRTFTVASAPSSSTYQSRPVGKLERTVPLHTLHLKKRPV